MFRLVLTRIVQIIATLWLASSAVFVMIHVSGDPTQGFLPPGVSPEVREQMRDRLGLNDPLWQQYFSFIGRGFVGDFGDSWRDGQPALNAVIDRLPATLQLGVAAIILATVTGIAYALLSQRSGRIHAILQVLPSFGQAVPTFWLGAMLMMIFAVRLGWLPSSGNGSAQALILPVLTLALQPASSIARLLSTSMDDVVAADFVRTARSKGLGPGAITRRHIAPNALLPTIAFVGLQTSFLVGGAVVVESLFAWPGVGRLALQSAIARDLPVVHAFVAVTAIGVIGINLIVDVLQVIVDPRLRSHPVSGAAHG